MSIFKLNGCRMSQTEIIFEKLFIKNCEHHFGVFKLMTNYTFNIFFLSIFPFLFYFSCLESTIFPAPITCHDKCRVIYREFFIFPFFSESLDDKSNIQINLVIGTMLKSKYVEKFLEEFSECSEGGFIHIKNKFHKNFEFIRFKF